MRHSSTLIVIPAYNEAALIGEVVSGVRAVVGEAQILVVDDGSCDDTAQRAQRAGAQVLRHSQNRGYGAALLSGYRHAVEQGAARVIQLDADGQHDAASIGVILQALAEGADLVLGSRFLDPRSYRPAAGRRLGIRLFSFLAGRAIEQPITDATTGYQGLSRRLLRFYIERGFPCDYPDANMIIRAARAGYRVREVPARMRASTGPASIHHGWRPLLYVVKMLGAVALEWSRRVAPVSEEEGMPAGEGPRAQNGSSDARFSSSAEETGSGVGERSRKAGRDSNGIRTGEQ